MNTAFPSLTDHPFSTATLVPAWLGLVILSAAITWLMARRIRIMDQPNARSSHDRPVPRSGGVAIVVTFLVGMTILAAFDLGNLTDRTGLAFFLPAALLVAGISFYDDIFDARFTVKLLVQGLAVMLLLAGGLTVEHLSFAGLGKIPLGWFAYPVTILWVVGATNAFNFMDGLDGLAAGVAALVCLFFGLAAMGQANGPVPAFCFLLLAGVVGLLLFNLPPAKIFMGDVGSAFLGFTFAGLAILAARHEAAPISFWIMPLLLLHFIFDTTLTMLRRLARGENITCAHRDHLYQLQNRLGASHLTVSLTQYGMTALQGVTALIILRLDSDKGLLLLIPALGLQLLYAGHILRRAKQQGLLGTTKTTAGTTL